MDNSVIIHTITKTSLLNINEVSINPTARKSTKYEPSGKIQNNKDEDRFNSILISINDKLDAIYAEHSEVLKIVKELKNDSM